MKHVVVYRDGDGHSDARGEDGTDVAAPGRGQVVVGVTLFPIHRSDLQQLAGVASEVPLRGVGMEAIGVIEAVGPGVSSLRMGMRVSVFPHSGTWAQRILADADTVRVVPDTVPDDVAAQMHVNPLTMLMLRREADKHAFTAYDGSCSTRRDTPVGVLLTAGLSHHSIPTISMVNTDDAATRLRARFPHVPVVVTDGDDWGDRVRALAEGRTIGIGFDPVGGRGAADLVDLLSPGGTLVLYRRDSDASMPLHASLQARSITFRGVNVESWLTDTPPRRRASDINTAMAVATLLTDQFDTAATYPITAIQEALAHAASATTVGTVLVKP
jgi:NADPH:quinone reductase-like Zn-dependent oxidoreductase